jgi:butyrate kinase
MKILVINPGGVTIRLAMFEDTKEIWNERIDLDLEFIKSHPVINEQFEERYNAIVDLLKKKKEDLHDVAAIAARGGNLLRITTGAYEVTDELLRRLREEANIDHASNIAAALAEKLGRPLGIKSYIYDAVTSDEILDISRITGIKEIRRRGRAHVLNIRAAAIETAKRLNKDFNETNILVTHLGSGISFAVLNKGKMADVISDDEGAFSPERAGFIPPYRLIELIFEHNYTKSQVMQVLTRAGGLMSLTGSTDFLVLEKAAIAGDEWANMVYDALVLNIAKSIGRLSVVVCGKLDAITVTGSIAQSKMLVEKLKNRIDFIAPIHVLAGEFEMASLANGIYRVITGREKAKKIENETTFDNYEIY